MGSDADMEDYGFEYSDDEPEEQDVDIENQYYNSKGLVETDPEEALAVFSKGAWARLGKTRAPRKTLGRGVSMNRRLGTRLSPGVKCLGRAPKPNLINRPRAWEFYETTLKALEEAKNERLWFKTNLKLCTIWFDMVEYGRMGKVLKELHKSCRREDGTDDRKKGTQLLESNRRTIMDDPFIRNYIEDLLKNIRTQVLLKLIKPYTRIRIPFVSKELNVPEKDVEQLLVSLILDNRIQGHIDQVNRLLERNDRYQCERIDYGNECFQRG
ncbi:hypothetical protein C4D60_Mb06t09430 [Musa balbisiana]|uniref:PCI domain-containing protein n=1 Tax=Musa balbisiana TaxID=52838 RepID=A0A4S8IN50_MUSBA|nr:hypothetical protein C4D60_Mb06t09430 [Musa balbisiana]